MRAKRILAKYSSTCPNCSGPINPGQSVWWRRGAAATHADCNAARFAADQEHERTRADRQCHTCPSTSARMYSPGPYTVVACPDCWERWKLEHDAGPHRPPTSALNVPDRFDMAYEDDCARRCGL